MARCARPPRTVDLRAAWYLRGAVARARRRLYTDYSVPLRPALRGSDDGAFVHGVVTANAEEQLAMRSAAISSPPTPDKRPTPQTFFVIDGIMSSRCRWRKEKAETTPDRWRVRPPSEYTSLALPAIRSGSVASETERETKKPNGTSHTLKRKKQSTCVAWRRRPRALGQEARRRVARGVCCLVVMREEVGSPHVV